MKNWILFLGLFFNSILLFGQLHYTNRELPCLNKTFNVHVHVVLDSFGNSNVTEAEIRSKVAAVSEKFAPICMDFKVCEIDYIVKGPTVTSIFVLQKSRDPTSALVAAEPRKASGFPNYRR